MMGVGDEAEKKRQYHEYQELEDLAIKEVHKPKNDQEEGRVMEQDAVYRADPKDPSSARVFGSQALQLGVGDISFSYRYDIDIDIYVSLLIPISI